MHHPTSVCVAVLLLLSELWGYTHVAVATHMRVSTSHVLRETTVHMHITLPHLPCDNVMLEVENIRVRHVFFMKDTHWSPSPHSLQYHQALSRATLSTCGSRRRRCNDLASGLTTVLLLPCVCHQAA